MMKCLYVSANPAIRVDQAVETTAKTDTQIMSAIPTIALVVKSVRTSRFSDISLSRQGMLAFLLFCSMNSQLVFSICYQYMQA